MTDNVRELPKSREDHAIRTLLEGCFDSLDDFQPAAAAVVMVGKDGTIRHHINGGASAVALLGAAETLKQYIYSHYFMEQS